MEITFDEIELPTEITYSFTGGPKRNNTFVVTASGLEYVNINWAKSKRIFTCNKVLSLADRDSLIAFFEARSANARGFRFKDRNDYYATDSPQTVTGAPTFQLTKLYDDTLNPVTREIKKVRSSPAITMTRGGSPFSSFSIDENTGIVTLAHDSSKAITGISKAASAVVTCIGHSFSLGEIVYFSGIVGMTEMNGQVGTITLVGDSDHFTVNINSSGYTTYSSAGIAKKYVQPSEDLLATFQFDVPVKFTNDQLIMTMDDPQSVTISGLDLMEIRI